MNENELREAILQYIRENNLYALMRLISTAIAEASATLSSYLGEVDEMVSSYRKKLRPEAVEPFE